METEYIDSDEIGFAQRWGLTAPSDRSADARWWASDLFAGATGDVNRRARNSRMPVENRALQTSGVRPKMYVKPYVKRGESDAVDAAAICEAVTRPTMRFVAIKPEEQQAGHPQ